MAQKKSRDIVSLSEYFDANVLFRKDLIVDKKLTFNEDPELYDRMRPKYPVELINDVILKTALSKDKEILEIGPGTGQITYPFVEKGYLITCIELGKELADFLKTKLKVYQNVKLINSSFEDWKSEGKTFDLIISAQAFHWIDKQVGYQKVANLLKPSGFLALIWIFTEAIEFRSEFDRAYQKYLPDSKPPESIEIQIQKRYSEIASANIYKDIRIFQYPFSIEYSTEEYLDLLNTYSDHRSLEERTRNLLFTEIKNIIDCHGGKIRENYVATLYLMHC